MQTENTEQTEQNAPEPIDPQAAIRQAGDAFGAVSDILAAFVVQERYVIEDINGNHHTFRPVLPMRRQLEASFALESFVSKRLDSEVVAEAQAVAAESGKLQGVLHFLRVALADPETADDIERVFLVLHPGMLKNARHLAERAWRQQTNEQLDNLAAEALEDAAGEARDLARKLYRAALAGEPLPEADGLPEWLATDGLGDLEVSYHPDEGPPTHPLDLFEADALIEAMLPFFARAATRMASAVKRLAAPKNGQASPGPSRPTPAAPSSS